MKTREIILWSWVGAAAFTALSLAVWWLNASRVWNHPIIYPASLVLVQPLLLFIVLFGLDAYSWSFAVPVYGQFPIYALVLSVGAYRQRFRPAAKTVAIFHAVIVAAAGILLWVNH